MQHPGSPTPSHDPHNSQNPRDPSLSAQHPAQPAQPGQKPPAPHSEAILPTPPISSAPPPLTPNPSVTPDAPTLANMPLDGPQYRRQQMYGPPPAWQPGGQPGMPGHGQASGQPGQHNTAWRRFRGMPRVAQVLIAVGVALTLMVCTCCGSIGVIGALGGGSPSALSTATANTRGGSNAGFVSHQSTATTGPTQTVATATATATATAEPTATARALPTATAKPIPQPTATPKPIPQPTATPKPSCPYPAVNNNPWCYTFTNTGKYIYRPPSNFCNYFTCIKSFWTSANGYVEECQDGMYSHSGGVSGSCSWHGGNLRPLFAP